MLVLARQLNERIVMPSVPATIEVVAIKPNGIRLGIDAPSEVTILREEVLRRGGMPANELLAPTESEAARLKQLRQVLRNRLQTVVLGLELIREQLDDRTAAEPRTMLERIETEVGRLDRQLQSLLSPEPNGTSLLAATPASSCIVVEAEGEFSI